MPDFTEMFRDAVIALRDGSPFDTPEDEALRLAMTNCQELADGLAMMLRAGSIRPSPASAASMLCMFTLGFRVGARIGMPTAETARTVN